jgi:hypothetical protein
MESAQQILWRTAKAVFPVVRVTPGTNEIYPASVAPCLRHCFLSFFFFFSSFPFFPISSHLHTITNPQNTYRTYILNRESHIHKIQITHIFSTDIFTITHSHKFTISNPHSHNHNHKEPQESIKNRHKRSEDIRDIKEKFKNPRGILALQSGASRTLQGRTPRLPPAACPRQAWLRAAWPPARGAPGCAACVGNRDRVSVLSREEVERVGVCTGWVFCPV